MKLLSALCTAAYAQTAFERAQELAKSDKVCGESYLPSTLSEQIELG